MKNITSLVIILILQGNLFSQKTNAVAVTGTVYISSSTSYGVADGGGSTTLAQPFKKQRLYFLNGNDTTIVNTDTVGVFKTQLNIAGYTIFQESGLKSRRGLGIFGTAFISVSEKNAPYKIELHNSFNLRSSMGGKGSPSSKATKKSKAE